MWLPPLPSRLALARVIPDELDPHAPRPVSLDRAGLPVPLGLLDNPAKQRQEPWIVDLARAGGHHAVIGAPGTGRSTFLRTVAASLALTHTPREVSVYGMDLTGGGLRRIEGFPHVGGVATRAHPDRLLRLLEELSGMLALREAVFRERSIDSLGLLRARHAAGQMPELISAEVVLLVDGVGLLRNDFEELETPLFDLLQRGGSFGIHLVLAMTRWNDIRMAQQPLIGSRYELRLNDPADSSIGRKLNAALRPDQPGRLLTDDSLFAQVALPVLDDAAEEDLGAGPGEPGGAVGGELAGSGRRADPAAADRARAGGSAGRPGRAGRRADRAAAGHHGTGAARVRQRRSAPVGLRRPGLGQDHRCCVRSCAACSSATPPTSWSSR